MNMRLLALAGLLLGSLLATSDALAFGSRHGGGGDSSSSVSAAASFNNENGTNGTTYDQVGVPEPSSLYAIGAALALVGATGWMLRRKR